MERENKRQPHRLTVLGSSSGDLKPSKPWHLLEGNQGQVVPFFLGKERRGIQIRREKVKYSLYVDDKILYTENPKDVTQKR